MPAGPDRRISQAVDTNGERSVAEKAIRSKRPTPSWLEPVDLSALTAAADAGVDDERSKRRRGDENVGDDAPSTSSETKDDDEVDEDSHVWMREALRVHLLDRSKEGDGEGESTEEVDIAEESLDMLASCLGGVLEKVLAEAKGGAEGVGELTSLDIHKSIKSLFPEKGGEGKKGLRPYLPRVVKDAWRLDKKSLPKGAKKRSGMSRQIF
jgi:hypothetical protein